MPCCIVESRSLRCKQQRWAAVVCVSVPLRGLLAPSSCSTTSDSNTPSSLLAGACRPSRRILTRASRPINIDYINVASLDVSEPGAGIAQATGHAVWQPSSALNQAGASSARLWPSDSATSTSFLASPNKCRRGCLLLNCLLGGRHWPGCSPSSSERGTCSMITKCEVPGATAISDKVSAVIYYNLGATGMIRSYPI